jgi:hypothetical protein
MERIGLLSLIVFIKIRKSKKKKESQLVIIRRKRFP